MDAHAPIGHYRGQNTLSAERHLQYNKNRIDASLLGKIVLARFLELPLRTFDRFVVQAGTPANISALSSWVTEGCLGGAQVAHEAAAKSMGHPSSVLGEVREIGEELTFFYHRDSCTREYRFNEEGISRLMSDADFPLEWGRVLRRLRLINTRNRLTHGLIRTVVNLQAAYLRTGQGMSLLPLTQTDISARLRLEANLSVVADPGRISRLVRGLSIMLPNKKVIPLNTLFPKPRQVHCHFIDHVIKAENVWMAEGALREPLTDTDVADVLDREYGIFVSRRTVTNIRHDLGIPDRRSRGQRTNYLAATAEFSALVPMTHQALRTVVPAHPGVYEIQAASASWDDEENAIWATRRSMPTIPHGVVYIGSTGDLRKRLADHLRGNSDNTLLHRHIAGGAARVRYRLLSEEWRLAERELYRVFCETFGEPPLCNRMSP
ncbi:sigma-54, DNA binding domain [mine drainage metagenome]|uniref:Sigma-54, DNA binding domain n=1 Tax=mine drainage metagenome TaxID=410659 RepID=A0A1J5RSM3_9ZZZZ